MRLKFWIYILLITVVALSGQEEKRELVVLRDDFSNLQWQTWSYSVGDSVVHFRLDGSRSRSAPTSVSIKGTLNTRQDEWLVSPLLDFSRANAVPVISFYEAQDFWLQSNGRHQLLYAFGPNPSKGDFVTLYEWNNENHLIANFLAAPSSFTLEPVVGKSEVTIAFRYVNDTTDLGDNWYIDDLLITQDILYDASVTLSSLTDGQKISVNAETPVRVYVQNRGLEKLRFPVRAELRDYRDELLWSASDTSGELDSFGKDTLVFNMPAGTDSSTFFAVFFTDAATDQYRGNDTLRLKLQSYPSSRLSLAESFLYSGNYFSEGTYLALDSAMQSEGTNLSGQHHFFSSRDTLYRESSGILAEQYAVETPSLVLVNRKERINISYTSLQDWTKGISKITAVVSAVNLLGSPLMLDGRVTSSAKPGSFEISYQITQTADLPAQNFVAEVWLIDGFRSINWLRLNRLKNRGFERISAVPFGSGSRNDIIGDETFLYDVSPGEGTDSLAVDRALFLLIVSDSVSGEVLNSFYLPVQEGIISGIDDSNTLAENFEIIRSWPNPFNPEVSVRFFIREGNRISIDIFSVDGRKVYTSGQYYGPGEHIFRWNAADKASGIYFLRLTTGKVSRYTKLILAK